MADWEREIETVERCQAWSIEEEGFPRVFEGFLGRRTLGTYLQTGRCYRAYTRVLDRSFPLYQSVETRQLAKSTRFRTAMHQIEGRILVAFDGLDQ